MKSQPAWLTYHFQGKSFDVWSWSFGNFGYFFLHHYCHMSISRSLSKGDQHRKQRKMLNLVFSTAHMREMSMCCSLLSGESTQWRSSSDILRRLLQGTRHLLFSYLGSNSNIVVFKASSCLCSSSQRWISRGYNTLCLLIHYLISHLVVFRLTYFPGWLALH